jgi:HSP20 family protein
LAEYLQEAHEEHYHRVERTYGMFVRSVRLPVTVDGSKVVASFKNGLLAVTLPKTPTAFRVRWRLTKPLGSVV